MRHAVDSSLGPSIAGNRRRSIHGNHLHSSMHLIEGVPLTESPRMIRSALINVMTAAAIKAGRGLKRDFGEVENLQVSVKGPGDFVSAADRKAEKILPEELARARPG